MILFHGTSGVNAKKIEEEGFKVGVNYNWDVKGKKGFVYFSTAYAPFYAMACRNNPNGGLALIKVEVDECDLFPEDDFLMNVLGKPKYTQNDLRGVSLVKNKHLWQESLRFMGNVAVRPNKIKILGVTYFSGNKLIYKCDPVISPINFKLLGDYYIGLTEWIFEGEDFMEYKNENDYFRERSKIVGVVG